MGCDSCQDCSSANITLPVVTGPTGATGATGAAGAAGTNGTTVLYNDSAQSTTSSATIALFSATKAYTMPAATLSTNGSKLILTALFSTTGLTASGDSTAYIYLAGSSFTALANPYRTTYYKGGTEVRLKVKLEITRVSDTDLFIVSDSWASDVFTGQIHQMHHFVESTTTVAALSANSLLIEARGKTTGTTTFNCDQLTIDHLIK